MAGPIAGAGRLGRSLARDGTPRPCGRRGASGELRAPWTAGSRAAGSAGVLTMDFRRLEVVMLAITLLLGVQGPFSVAADAPTVLKLERHNTLPGGGVVELPVNGTGNYMFHGPYLTRVKLGNPPQNFDVLIDTGSSLPWIGCETSAGITTRLFHPGPSTSALTCRDQRCQTLAHAGYGGCNSSSNGCIYDLGYGNGDSATFSEAAGYYVTDLVHFDGPTSARIVFGCTNSWMGQLSHGSFDGIFGLSPFGLSFISQLYSNGVSGKIFTLCMHSPTGGGILAFGEAVEPGLTYTALLPSASYYQLDLQSIVVNGQTLPIDSSVFRPSPDHFTFVDSGSTLVYLADGAFDPFINAIRPAFPPSAVPFTGKNGEICFATATSFDPQFPSVELHFTDGAKMLIHPHNYLYYVDPSGYCIAWLRNTGRQVTLLGDIVLVDKLIVHDMERMRLGWIDYDCSQPINVTNSRGKKYTNSGHITATTFRVVLLISISMILHTLLV